MHRGNHAHPGIALHKRGDRQWGDRQRGPDPSPGKLRALREPGDRHARHDTQRYRQRRQPQRVTEQFSNTWAKYQRPNRFPARLNAYGNDKTQGQKCQ